MKQTMLDAGKNIIIILYIVLTIDLLCDNIHLTYRLSILSF